MRTLRRLVLIGLMAGVAAARAEAALPDPDGPEAPLSSGDANRGALHAPRKRRTVGAPRPKERRRAPKRPDVSPDAQARIPAADRDRDSR